MAYTVKYIRCDNAGEINEFQEICMKRGLGITFEFTPAGNPQFNGRIERKFATLYGRVRSMLNKAQLTKDLRSKCWAECARTATKLENSTVTRGKNKSPHEEFYGAKAKFICHLRRFGEICVVYRYENEKIRSKIDD